MEIEECVQIAIRREKKYCELKKTNEHKIAGGWLLIREEFHRHMVASLLGRELTESERRDMADRTRSMV